MKLKSRVVGGTTKKLKSRWSLKPTTPVHPLAMGEELGAILAKSLADEIDKEIVDHIEQSLTITATCTKRPKKGDLIRHVWDEYPWFHGQPSVTQPTLREQTGICIEDDMVMTDDGTLKALNIVEAVHDKSYVEVIE